MNLAIPPCERRGYGEKRQIPWHEASLWVCRAATLERSPGIDGLCLLFSPVFWPVGLVLLPTHQRCEAFCELDFLTRIWRAILRGFLLASLVSQVLVGTCAVFYQGLGYCLPLFWLVYACQDGGGQLKPRYSFSGHSLGPVDYWHCHQFIRSWGKAPLCIRALVRDKACVFSS